MDKVIAVSGGGRGLDPARAVCQPWEIAHTAVFLFENDCISHRVIETVSGITR